MVLCSNVELLTGNLKGYKDGQAVVVLVRPENIKIQAEKSQQKGWNVIPGEIETITFHGAITRLGVNVNGQRVVADITVANTQPVSLNQKIWLGFPPDACQVMVVEE
jgi:putative spermidine/putrescine transport system ATP-binding protein